MSSHPDADAFIRAFLRTPPDATTRLAFADWLDEYDTPSCRAWAAYIRLKAEADRHPSGSVERKKRDAAAAAHAPSIRARLTIPAKVFVRNRVSLLQLLPPDNIAVWLRSFRTPLPPRDWVGEAVARNNTIFPLDREADVLLVATAQPLSADFIEKAEYIYRARIVAVRADQDDILAAHERNYWPPE
jgi:uncharacterized protein (TIGR02996 family)